MASLAAFQLGPLLAAYSASNGSGFAGELGDALAEYWRGALARPVDDDDPARSLRRRSA